jgi:hypothetical protein
MQNNIFPKFDTHAAVDCFHCDAPIGHEKPINYGFARGAYGMWCNTCKLRTYYDTPDTSIKFDKKGDPLPATCECGCTTPRDQWDSSDGWPRCPQCQYI